MSTVQFNLNDWQIQRELFLTKDIKIQNLQSKNHEDQVISRIEINNIDKLQIQNIKSSFEQRQLIKFPKLVQFQNLDFSDLDNKVISIFFEQLSKNLKNDQEKRKEEGEFYQANDLLSFFNDIYLTIFYLKFKKMLHGDICPQLIFQSQQGNWKLLDQIIRMSNPLMFQYKKIQNGNDLYMSPEMFHQLMKKQKNIKINLFKSELFTLGIVLLYMGTLLSVQKIYDQQAQYIDLEELQRLKNIFNNRYKENQNLLDILDLLLKIDPNERNVPTMYQNLSSYLEKQFENDPQNFRNISINYDENQSLVNTKDKNSQLSYKKKLKVFNDQNIDINVDQQQDNFKEQDDIIENTNNNTNEEQNFQQQQQKEQLLEQQRAQELIQQQKIEYKQQQQQKEKEQQQIEYEQKQQKQREEEQQQREREQQQRTEELIRQQKEYEYQQQKEKEQIQREQQLKQQRDYELIQQQKQQEFEQQQKQQQQQKIQEQREQDQKIQQEIIKEKKIIQRQQQQQQLYKEKQQTNQTIYKSQDNLTKDINNIGSYISINQPQQQQKNVIRQLHLSPKNYQNYISEGGYRGSFYGQQNPFVQAYKYEVRDCSPNQKKIFIGRSSLMEKTRSTSINVPRKPPQIDNVFLNRNYKGVNEETKRMKGRSSSYSAILCSTREIKNVDPNQKIKACIFIDKITKNNQ